MSDTRAHVIESEQDYFDRAWEAREKSRQTLLEAGSAAGGPNKTVAAVRADAKRRAESMGGPEDPVAFGRFDRDGECQYIGYHGISTDERDLLVINWRTPGAEPFYKATIQEPLGLAMKRTFVTTQNQIDDFSDVVFAQMAEAIADLTGAEQWGIDDHVLRDLEVGRTGEMRDIVQTIHASQYELIRSPLEQLLIVQGGPGTGKTAIALHRISWLLFNHVRDLPPEDCLVVGPNPTFTRYIKAVLPGLGDRDVAYRDLRGLGPQRSSSRRESAATTRLKGEERMATLLSNALWHRVRFPVGSTRLVLGADPAAPSFGQEEIEVELDRRRGQTYNSGRNSMRSYLQVEANRRSSRRDGVAAAAIENALERVWPSATPQSLLRDLLGSRERLMSAADSDQIEFTVTEIRSLQRAPQDKLSNEQWSDADVALLDELNSLINGTGETFAQIVVDEAQDLSPMQLRSLRRRSRTGSYTIVGDIAQSTGPWARDTWDDVVTTLAKDAPQSIHELSLGYRVPRQVFEFASQLLPIAAPAVVPPRVVREGPASPELLRVDPSDLAASAVGAARQHAGSGRFVGLICPDALREEVIDQFNVLRVSWANVRAGELDKSINLASPEESKGLEFDAIVVVQPAKIVTEVERGHRMLYVALTRTTQYLTVVHDGVAMPLSSNGSADAAPGGTAELHTVSEPPRTAAAVTESSVKSGVSDPVSLDEPPEQVAAPVVPPPGTRRAGDSGTRRRLADRVTRLLAQEVAAEVVPAMQPSSYAAFVDALRRELNVSADELLEHLVE